MRELMGRCGGQDEGSGVNYYTDKPGHIQSVISSDIYRMTNSTHTNLQCILLLWPFSLSHIGHNQGAYLWDVHVDICHTSACSTRIKTSKRSSKCLQWDPLTSWAKHVIKLLKKKIHCRMPVENLWLTVICMIICMIICIECDFAHNIHIIS